jgi:hypothetical protein
MAITPNHVYFFSSYAVALTACGLIASGIC